MLDSAVSRWYTKSIGNGQPHQHLTQPGAFWIKDFQISGYMEKLILIKCEFTMIGNNSTWYATTENGEVPERFHAYADFNGDFSLIRVIPVLNLEGIETWIEDDSLEEVEVELLEDFAAKYLPGYKKCRWFASKKLATIAPKQSTRRLLNR